MKKAFSGDERCLSDSTLHYVQKRYQRWDTPTRPPKPQPLRSSNSEGFDKNLGIGVHMSFTEIGLALGISKQAASQTYQSAIRKIRKIWRVHEN